MPTWNITGEASKAMDATTRTAEQISARKLRLRLETAGIDRLTWTTPLADITGTGAVLPEEGQEVTLERDSTTVFVGTCDKVKVSWKGGRGTAAVSVAGAGWWLDRINISGDDSDEAAQTYERPAYVLPEGDAAGMVEALIDRAAALGAPVDHGTMPTTYDAPQTTLEGMTFLQALAEVLRWLPDAFTWWDYTTSPPQLNLARRGSASVLSLVLGTDSIASFDLEPETELEVEGLTLSYAERTESGTVFFREQDTQKTPASYTTSLTGANNDFTVTAIKPGADGNDLTLSISTSASTKLEARVEGDDVTIYAPNFTTAQTIVDLINNAPPQNAFAIQGGTNKLRYTAVEPGAAGDDIEVVLTNSGSGTTVSSVTVSSGTITVTKGSNATVQTIAEAINSTAAASRLVTAEHWAGSATGTTVTVGSSTATLANGMGGVSTILTAELAASNDGTGTVPVGSSGPFSLTSGSDGTAAGTGKRQIIATTGPELVPFLPVDPADCVLVESGDNTAWQMMVDKNDRIRRITKEHGSFTLSDYTSGVGTTAGYNGTVPATRSVLGGDTDLSYYIKNATVPDWIYDIEGSTFGEIVREGSFYYLVSPYLSYGALSSLEQALYDEADTLKIIGGTGLYMFFNLSATAIGTDTSWNRITALRRPGSFAFLGIPDGFADDLKGAQNFVPHRGRIELAGENTPADLIGRVVNLSGGVRSAWASMKALPSALDFDLYRSRATVELGAQPRQPFRSLASRIGVSPRDSVTLIK